MERLFKNKFTLFLFVSLLGTGLFFVAILLDGNARLYEWLVMEHNYDWQFSDFFRQIVFASDLKHIYYDTLHASFPPLAYLFYYALYRMNPKAYEVDLASWEECAGFQFNGMIFLMVQIVYIVLLYAILRKYFKKLSEQKLLGFVLALIFSAPIGAGALERGNAALFTIILCLYAIYLKDAEKQWQRQLSLVLLAVAVGFKIYPGILILLWLKDKRYKDILAFSGYCVVFLLLPFCFTGGWGGFVQYCKDLRTMNSALRIRWTSVELYLYSLCETLRLPYLVLAGTIINVLLLAIDVLMALCTKSKWRAMLFLATPMAVFVSNSYRYVAVYLLLPLVWYLCEEKEMFRRMDFVYTILFGMIFTVPIWAIKLDVDFAIFTPIYLLNIIAIIEEMKIQMNMRERKTS